MQINDLTFGRVQNVCFALAPRRVPAEKRGRASVHPRPDIDRLTRAYGRGGQRLRGLSPIGDAMSNADARFGPRERPCLAGIDCLT